MTVRHETHWSARALFLLCPLLIALMTLPSCTSAPDPVPQPESTERIHLELTGDLVRSIDRIATNGLIADAVADPVFYRDGEHQLDIDLGSGTTLRIFLFEHDFYPVLEHYDRYSAYPLPAVKDRSTYFVAQYIDENGDIRFSTTHEGGPPDTQLHTLEITGADATGCSGRFLNLRMYEVPEENVRKEVLSPKVFYLSGTFRSIR